MHILLADSRSRVRSALRSLLEEQSGRMVVSEAGDCQELLAQAETACPDLVLIDWDLPGMATVDLLPALQAMCPDLHVIALSGRPEAGAEMARPLAGMMDTAGADLLPGKAETRVGPAPPTDPVEITALAVRALLLVDPGSKAAREGARWLQSRRRLGTWPSPRGHAAALEALCLLEGKAAAAATR